MTSMVFQGQGISQSGVHLFFIYTHGHFVLKNPSMPSITKDLSTEVICQALLVASSPVLGWGQLIVIDCWPSRVGAGQVSAMDLPSQILLLLFVKNILIYHSLKFQLISSSTLQCAAS